MKTVITKGRILSYFSVIGLLTGCDRPVEDKEFQSYKNVVVIVGDDHAYTVLGAYGNEKIRTPNLDELAQEGVRFTNAYSSSPLCSASRQSLLTGKYPHQTGVNLLFAPFNDEINTTLAEHLKDEGFATALMGKAHFNSFIWWELYDGKLPKFGFDTLIDNAEYKKWLEQADQPEIPENIMTYGDDTGLPKNIEQMNPLVLPQACYDEYCQGTFLARQSINFMDENKDGRFLLWLAFHEPHAPFDFPIEYSDSYDPEDMTLPEGSPEDDRWIPERFRGFTSEQKKGVKASYYTSVEYMDKNVGLVIQALKDLGIYDETLIVYLGDQGYLLYDHKRFEKHTMWEESVKAPLILRGKTIDEDKAFDEVVEFIDVAPTICEALGVPEMEEAEGKSFYSLITGGEYEEQKYAFSEFLEDNKAMVASKKWKYIFTTGKRDLGQGYATGYGPSGIYHRLYDLQEDPGETTNLAYLPEYEEKLKELQEVMINFFMETYPYVEELPPALNRIGKLVWFCEPRDVGAEYGGVPLRVWE